MAFSFAEMFFQIVQKHYQNYCLMIVSRGSEQIRERPMVIRSVKISNFDVPLGETEEAKRRYSPDQKIMRNRNMTGTPQSSRTARPLSLQRQVQSSHQKRLSYFLEKEIGQLHENRERINQFSEFTKDKINQLRSIMQMKSASMRVSKIQEPIYCHFTQYKLNQGLQLGNSSLLHARNTKNSPFTRSIKVKKMVSKSTELKKTAEEEFKSIEVGAESKYCRIKKMVLTGGAMRSQASNPESRQALFSRLGPTRGSHVKNIRKLKQNVLPSQMQNTINDCRPWQMDKNQINMEQSLVQMS